MPFFIDYMRGVLSWETTDNVVAKLKDGLDRFEKAAGFRCRSYISNSFNGMRDVRRSLISEKVDQWAYVCAAHCLNNLSEGIEKLRFCDVIKEGIFISKTVRNNNLLLKPFDVFCSDKCGKKYALLM